MFRISDRVDLRISTPKLGVESTLKKKKKDIN